MNKEVAGQTVRQRHIKSKDDHCGTIPEQPDEERQFLETMTEEIIMETVQKMTAQK